MSKELEALEVIKKASTKSSGWVDDLIEHAYSYEINILEKVLKALEIIKEKEVNIYHFCLIQVYDEKYQLERYNDSDFVPENDFLTQEEFDLLKEVL